MQRGSVARFKIEPPVWKSLKRTAAGVWPTAEFTKARRLFAFIAPVPWIRQNANATPSIPSQFRPPATPGSAGDRMNCREHVLGRTALGYYIASGG